jgi:signal transduction histidine kinase
MNKLSAFLLISFVCYSKICISQAGKYDKNPSYSVKNYTDENGLPQNSVKSIVQDSEGFIWLATENGLVRFDGNNFKIYDKFQLGISSNRFVVFQPGMDDSGRNLFATTLDHLYISIDKGKLVLDSLYYKSCLNKIQLLIDKNVLPVISLGSPASFRQGEYPDNYVVPISGVGKFYICYHNRIEYYDNWRKKKVINANFSQLWDVFRLDGNLVSLNKNGTVTVYNGSVSNHGSNHKIIGDILNNVYFKRHPDKTTIHWNNAANQVFLYVNKSLYTIEFTGSGQVKTRLLIDDFDFETNFISSIYYDKTNRRLFLGSVTKGLFIFSERQFFVARFDDNEAENVFYAQTIVNDSTLMVPQGYTLGMKGARNKTIEEIPAVKKYVAYSQYFYTDKLGNRYGGDNASLFRFSTDGKKLLNHWKLGLKVEGLLHVQKDLLLIITDKGAIFTMNPMDKNPVPELFGKGPPKPQSMHLKQNTLWVPSQNGLYKIDIVSKKMTIIPGTKNLNIRSLYFSTPEQLWLTTYEDGFFLYEKGLLTHLPSDKNHYLNTSHCIIEDKGYFWIPTNKGLFSVLKSELLDYAKNKIDMPYFHRYSREDGFNTNEFNGGCEPCGLKMGNGFVSFPSLNGLVWFKPEYIQAEMPDNSIFLDQVSLNGKPFDFTGDSLYFPVDPTDIQILISSPYFGDVNNINITSKLFENGKKMYDWQTVANSGLIQITNLNSGEYTLLIKKKNGFGVDNYSYKIIKIFVKKAWYQSAVFQIIFVLIGLIVVLGLFYFYVKNRITNVIERNQQLERAIYGRTKDLQETLQVLRKSNRELGSQIHAQSGIVASITHDVRAPLNSVIYVVRHMQNLANKKEFERIPEMTGAVLDTSTRMKILLDNLLDYIKINVFHEEVEKEFVELHDLVEQKFNLFSNAYSKSPNLFINDVKPGTRVYANYQMVAIIVHNLIDNANKYTYKGQVRVFTETYTNDLHLVISDTGSGMPQPMVDWLNTKISDMPGGNLSKNKDRGLGLVIIKEVAELTGTGLWAHTGSGTSVEVIFHDFEAE